MGDYEKLELILLSFWIRKSNYIYLVSLPFTLYIYFWSVMKLKTFGLNSCEFTMLGNVFCSSVNVTVSHVTQNVIAQAFVEYKTAFQSGKVNFVCQEFTVTVILVYLIWFINVSNYIVSTP